MMAITGFISRHIYVINCEWVKETLKKSSLTFCSAPPCASPLTGLARKFAPGEFFRDDKFAWSEFGRAQARPKGARQGRHASKTKSGRSCASLRSWHSCIHA